MEETSEIKEQPIEKKPFLKWNGEINFGNILTVIVILIAAGGLLYQKKLVQTKVDDLQVVVDKLEEEKLTRELQGLKLEENTNNSISYNLGYTIDQLRATDQITSYEFEVMLTEFNELIDISLKRTDLSATERKILELLKQRNLNKREIYIHGDIYHKKIIEFEQANEPKEHNYKTLDEFVRAKQLYVDTLSKQIKYLLHLQDSFTREPIKNVKQFENDYFDLLNKKKAQF